MRTRWMILLAIAGFTILATWTSVAGDFQTMSRVQPNWAASASGHEPARWSDGMTGEIVANGMYTLYLPLVTKQEPTPPPPPPSISGTVTYNGTPVAGILLQLRFTQDGSTFTTYSTTVTLADGTYRFTNLPTIQQSGQRYYVRYLNSANNAYLSSWYTRSITQNFSGEVNIGDFDIANISLNSPAHLYSGPLPVTFQWTKRGIPTDRYFLHLFDPADYDPRFLSDPPGDLSQHVLNNCPPGFSANVQYGWNVGVKSEDGGTGYSFYYHAITFTSCP